MTVKPPQSDTSRDAFYADPPSIQPTNTPVKEDKITTAAHQAESHLQNAKLLPRITRYISLPNSSNLQNAVETAALELGFVPPQLPEPPAVVGIGTFPSATSAPSLRVKKKLLIDTSLLLPDPPQVCFMREPMPTVIHTQRAPVTGIHQSDNHSSSAHSSKPKGTE